MKVVNFLFGKIAVPLLVALLTPVCISIGSKIRTDDWWEWFAGIPNQVWIPIGSAIFLWIIIIAIRYRLRQMHKDDSPLVSVFTVPPWGWKDVAKLTYAGVIWVVQAPKPSGLELDPPKITASDLELETPPRCPKCETEIEQSPGFLGGYVWRCAMCGFRKRNKDSYYRESERAIKIAKRKWEMNNAQNMP